VVSLWIVSSQWSVARHDCEQLTTDNEQRTNKKCLRKNRIRLKAYDHRVLDQSTTEIVKSEANGRAVVAGQDLLRRKNKLYALLVDLDRSR